MTMNNKRQMDALEVKELLESYAKGKKSRATVAKIPSVMAVVACGTAEFPNAANHLQKLYDTSESLLSVNAAVHVPSPIFFMAADMRGHRNASKVMVLSRGAAQGALEDCLGHWEGDKAHDVLRSHLAHFLSPPAKQT